VLLAAHCVEYKKGFVTTQLEFLTFLFQDDLYTDGSEYYISEIIVHPDWDVLTKPYEADIAIAILKEPVEFSSNVTNICLNSPSKPVDDNFIGQSGTVCWKNGTTVPIVDRDECIESPLLRDIYSDTLFCAGRTNINKGGLAVALEETWTLIGIVSAGRVENQFTPFETSDSSDYVLYTDVAKFHSWINRVIMETENL
jgi:hypothetical protein